MVLKGNTSCLNAYVRKETFPDQKKKDLIFTEVQTTYISTAQKRIRSMCMPSTRGGRPRVTFMASKSMGIQGLGRHWHFSTSKFARIAAQRACVLELLWCLSLPNPVCLFCFLPMPGRLCFYRSSDSLWKRRSQLCSLFFSIRNTREGEEQTFLQHSVIWIVNSRLRAWGMW